MNDTYDAVYNAVRSRFGSIDVADVIRSSIHMDASHTITLIQQEMLCAAYEMQRPSVLFRPTIAKDVDKWCAIYWQNLMKGIAGFGDTPDAAMRAFDTAWREKCDD